MRALVLLLILGTLAIAGVAHAAPIAADVDQAIGRAMSNQIDPAEQRDLAPFRLLADRVEAAAARLLELAQALPPADRERAFAADRIRSAREWVRDLRERLDDEDACRKGDRCMALRVCTVLEHRDDLRARIVEENRNAAGVVDLAYLHALGQGVRDDEAIAAHRKGLYARARKKAWTAAACLAPAKESE